jgi:ArsR family transcriptional regulator
MYEEEAKRFKVLSDPTRLRLLERMVAGESCGCTLIDKVEVSQPTLSYHLNLIADHGLARREIVGTRHNYRVDRTKLEALRDVIDRILHASDNTCEVGDHASSR